MRERFAEPGRPLSSNWTLNYPLGEAFMRTSTHVLISAHCFEAYCTPKDGSLQEKPNGSGILIALIERVSLQSPIPGGLSLLYHICKIL